MMKVKMFKRVVAFAAAAVMSIGVALPVGAEDLHYYKRGEELSVTANGGTKIFSGDTTNATVPDTGMLKINSPLTSDTRFLFAIPSWSGNNMYATMPYTTSNYKNSLLEMDVTLDDANSSDFSVSLGMAREEYYGSINYNGNRLLSQKSAKLSDYVEATTKKQTVQIPFEAFGEGIYGQVWVGSTEHYPLYKWEDALADAQIAIGMYDTLEPAKAKRKTVEAINGIEILAPKNSAYGLKVENIKVVPRTKTMVTGDDLYFYTDNAPAKIPTNKTGVKVSNVNSDTSALKTEKTDESWYFGVKDDQTLSADSVYVLGTKLGYWDGYVDNNWSYYGNLPITAENYQTAKIKFDVKLDDTNNTNIKVRLGAAREAESGGELPNYKDSRAISDLVSLSSYLKNTEDFQTVEIPVTAFGTGLNYQYWAGWGFASVNAKWTDLASGTSDTQTRNHEIKCVNNANSKVVESIHGIEFVLPSGSTSGITIKNLEVKTQAKRTVNGENTKIGYATGNENVIVGYGVFDESGNEVTALTGGSKITVGGCMINESENAEKATIMLALYKNGVFDRVYAFDANVKAGETGSMGGEFMTLPDDLTGYTAKALLWTGFGENEMRPILDSIQVNQ